MANHSTSTRPNNPNASLGKRLECPPTNSGATAKHQKIRIVTQWHHHHQRHARPRMCSILEESKAFSHVTTQHFPPPPLVFSRVYFDFYFGIRGAPRRRRAPTRAGESYAPLEHKKMKKKNLCASMHSKTDDFDAIHLIYNIQQRPKFELYMYAVDAARCWAIRL